MAGSDLVPLYYLSGIAGAMGMGIVAVRTWMKNQREKWTSEGAKEANLAQTLEDNTKAANGNTVAITKLVEQMQVFGEFMRETKATLTGHGRALDTQGEAMEDLRRQIQDGFRDGAKHP